jgi:hypothetical protein
MSTSSASGVISILDRPTPLRSIWRGTRYRFAISRFSSCV